MIGGEKIFCKGTNMRVKSQKVFELFLFLCFSRFSVGSGFTVEIWQNKIGCLCEAPVVALLRIDMALFPKRAGGGMIAHKSRDYSSSTKTFLGKKAFFTHIGDNK